MKNEKNELLRKLLELARKDMDFPSKELTGLEVFEAFVNASGVWIDALNNLQKLLGVMESPEALDLTLKNFAQTKDKKSALSEITGALSEALGREDQGHSNAAETLDCFVGSVAYETEFLQTLIKTFRICWKDRPG